MIPSHTKVAWAFLDKLLGRKPPPPVPDSDPGLSNKERSALLYNAVVHLAKQVNLAMSIASTAFVKQVIKISRKNGVDPRAIFHRMVLPQNRWPRLTPKARSWLSVMGSLAVTEGDAPRVGQFKPMPELEPMIALTMEEIGLWASKHMKSFLEQAYIENLQKEARSLIPVYTYPGEPRPTLPKVSLALMHEFEWRIDHARLPVGGANMMMRLFALFA
jgi:hypothetical protein